MAFDWNTFAGGLGSGLERGWKANREDKRDEEDKRRYEDEKTRKEEQDARDRDRYEIEKRESERRERMARAQDTETNMTKASVAFKTNGDANAFKDAWNSTAAKGEEITDINNEGGLLNVKTASGRGGKFDMASIDRYSNPEYLKNRQIATELDLLPKKSAAEEAQLGATASTAKLTEASADERMKRGTPAAEAEAASEEAKARVPAAREAGATSQANIESGLPKQQARTKTSTLNAQRVQGDLSARTGLAAGAMDLPETEVESRAVAAQQQIAEGRARIAEKVPETKAKAERAVAESTVKYPEGRQARASAATAASKAVGAIGDVFAKTGPNSGERPSVATKKSAVAESIAALNSARAQGKAGQESFAQTLIDMEDQADQLRAEIESGDVDDDALAQDQLDMLEAVIAHFNQ